jgi:hypothetical protein
MSKSHFLRQLERKQHLIRTSGHVDGPADPPKHEKTAEELDAELARAQIEKTKSEANYWQRLGETATREMGSDEVQLGLASNRRKLRFVLPRANKRPGWK